MADIRIKDLTTTASSTASDDFIAVDGTTNGTRKLNAFSPTFGGNATVTGTLTANGLLTAAATTSLDGLPTAAIFGATKRIAIGYNTSGDYGFVASADSGTTWKELHLNPSGGLVKVPSTSASTTTSTGALVVGNGTSGGLGVGGAASIGGPILVGTSSDVYLSRVGAGILDIRSASSPGTAARLDVTGTTSAGLGLRQTGTRDWFISAESSELRVSCLTAASIFAFNSGTPVAMRDTTASTSTSSGALVVSGGVGVAGKVTSTALGLANTSQSATAWGDVGVQLSVAGAVLTDTSSSGTVGRIVTNSIAASALAASSTTTYTAAASLFIAGAPTANTNVTITNAYALYTAGGRINFQGLPTSSAGLQAGTLWNDAGTLKVA